MIVVVMVPSKTKLRKERNQEKKKFTSIILTEMTIKYPFLFPV